MLVVEGGVATRDNGIYCEVGEVNGHGISALEHITELGRSAMAVVSFGTCSAFGGIPGADPNPTKIKRVDELYREMGIATPVVNVPGCPPHPDWFVGTVAAVLLGGVGALDLDAEGRPRAFFAKRLHDNCHLRGQSGGAQVPRQRRCLLDAGLRGHALRCVAAAAEPR